MLTDTVTATVWSFMLGDFVCVLCKSWKADENRVWTETVNCCLFCSLPHTVNFFSKPSDQYYIAAAFLYFTMLQAVQSVQCTVGQKQFHQKSSMLQLMEAANEKNKISSFLLTLHSECLPLFHKWHNFCFKNGKTL